MSNAVYAQDYTSNLNAASAPMEKGLPEITPGEKPGINAINPSYAWINPGEGLSGIYFIAGKKAVKIYDFWIIVVYPDGENQIHSIKMKSAGNGKFSGTFKINTEREINLIYNPDKGILFYYRRKNESFSALPVISIGKKAPGLSFNGADGNYFDLKKFEGKIIVLNWLANGRIPGYERMNSLLKKFGADSMAVFITASENGNNSGSELSSGIMNFFSASATGETLKLLGQGHPQTIIIGRDGTVKFTEPLGRGFNYTPVDSILNVLTGR